MLELPDPARPNDLAHRYRLLVVMPGVADHELQPPGAREREQLAGVVWTDRHRLLEQHVRAVLERCPGNRVVLRMGNRDDHRIELGRGQHLQPVGVGRRGAECAGRRAQALLGRVGQRREHGVRVVRQRGQVGLGRPPATADDTNPRRHYRPKMRLALPWKSPFRSLSEKPEMISQ